MRRLPPYRSARALVAALATGCVLYDPDARCHGGQVLDADETCACPAGTVPGPGGACLACGEHEVAVAGRCECAEGFGRPAAAQACAPLPAEVGSPCATADDCGDAAYPHCQETSAGGYCTAIGCDDDEDCPGDYACQAGVKPRYCRRPPLGQGADCLADGDCAGLEATHCETHVLDQCLVQGCTVEPETCFAGWECCDLASFGIAKTLCVPEGQCPTR